MVDDVNAFLLEGSQADPERERPSVVCEYAGECQVCFMPYEAGDLIRAIPDGSGWEAVDHDHDYDPETLLPVPKIPVEVGQRVILPPADPGLYAALAGPPPEIPEGAAAPGGPVSDELVPGEGESSTTIAQFTCTQCPKTYAPTKNKLVRKHSTDGSPCPGGGKPPRELAAPDVPQDPEEDRLYEPATPSERWPETTDPEALAALEKAAQQSPQVAAMRTRIAAGQTGMVPPAAGVVDAAKAMVGTPYAFPEIDPDTGVDLDVLASALLGDGTGPAGPVMATPGTEQGIWDPSWLWEHRDAEPEPERDGYGRYKLPHPYAKPGGPPAMVNWRRATTFAGVMKETLTLDAWQKRHLVRGAARNPELLAGAARLDIREDKPMLDALAEELATRSGVHEAAEQGTYIHQLTEDIDRELDPDARNAAWGRVPEKYLADVRAYQRALDQAGLRVVPSMLERRTAVTRYKVAGTFDQLLCLARDIPGVGSKGDYVIGDKKTGSTVTEYGSMGEYGVQLWLYAHGLNTSGVWDGHAGCWVPAPRVREDKGVIIHIPLGQGTCSLHVVDLEQGRESAALCQAVFDWRDFVKAKKSKLSVPLHSVTVPKEAAPVAAPPAPATADPSAPWQTKDWPGIVREVWTESDAKDAYDLAVTMLMPGDLVQQLGDALRDRLLFRSKWAGLYQAVRQVTSRAEAGALWGHAQAAGYPELDELAAAMDGVLDKRDDAAPVAAPAAPAPAPVAASVDWEAHARTVTDQQRAGQLWTAANQDPAMTEDRLAGLVKIMQAAITEPPF